MLWMKRAKPYAAFFTENETINAKELFVSRAKNLKPPNGHEELSSLVRHLSDHADKAAALSALNLSVLHLFFYPRKRGGKKTSVFLPPLFFFQRAYFIRNNSEHGGAIS